MTGPEPPPGRRIDGWLEPFFSDSTLWPVGLVLLLVLATLLAALWLLALGSRSPLAALALALLAAASAEGLWRDWRRGGPGRASALMLALWASSALIAGLAAGVGLV